ncbi:hypothetical protein D031_4713A, partial [Vibrio parahaemolyticus VP-48]
MGAALVRSDF